MKHLRLMCAALALLGIFAVLGYAQAVNGSLVGTVTDASGAAVPNARITATEADTGISRNTVTNESGNYTFADLPPGSYNVIVEQTGFKRAARAGVDVLVNTSPRVDLVLQPGNVSETINVTAEAPLLQTERADTGRQIETKQLADLPVAASRNFQSFIALVPGATKPFRPHSEFFNPQNALATQVNGQSRLGNNLQFEGIDDNERTGLLQVLIPPLEAVQTVDVTTSNYEAELGRATGAVTNVLLKSGTNNFHGQAYWFNRVSALSARNFYDSARGHFVYNYVGGQLGGPIVKNRTFFFGDYLRVSDHRYNGDNYTLPTAAQRMGDFNGASTTIYDPRTTVVDATGKVTRTPFMDNKIPGDRIDQVAAKILALVPLPNKPGASNNFFELIPFVRDLDQFDVKVDHNQTDNDRFAVRYSFERPVTNDGASFGAAGGPHGGGFQGTGIQNTHNGAINYNHIFSPTLIAEARFGVSRYRNDAQQVDYGKSDAQALGVQGVNVNAFTSGQVGIDIGGGISSPIIGYSPSLPWVRAETNIDFVNTWTKTKANHTFKWGVDLRRLRDDLLQTQTFSPRGLYRFREGQTSQTGAKTGTANDIASFLLGVPSEVGRDLPIVFPAYRSWEFFAFGQDKWQVTPKLTVDLGVRWEFYPPATPAHKGGFSNYDPVQNTLVIAGLGSNPSNLGLDKHYKDFAPRVGVAYRMTEKTVFRGGFGLSYAPFPDNTYAYNFPIKQNNAFEPGLAGFGPALYANGQPVTLSGGFPAPTVAVIPDNGIITNPDKNQVYEVINKHFREPYVESWNVAVQQSLPHNLVLDVAYVGNHGVAQPALYNLNAATATGQGVNGQPLFQAFGRKADTNLRYVGFSSSYNALQVKLDHRFSGGFAMTTAYTYSKSLGYQSEDQGLAFYVNPQRNYARTDFDRTHVFVQSYVYELPFGKGRRYLQSGPVGWVVGGWQLNGILTLQSGLPLNFTTSGSSLAAPGNTQTPDLIGHLRVLHGVGGSPWFDPTQCSATVTTNCFAAPAPGTFGNVGRNILGGPGFFNLDASIFRSFRFTERFHLELRGEAFGVTNTPQFASNRDDLKKNLGDSNFGFITGASGNRQVQMGAKIIF